MILSHSHEPPPRARHHAELALAPGTTPSWRLRQAPRRVGARARHHAELVRSYNARMWGFSACALLLLPGLMIVRTPWRLVPLLSIAFWLVAWTFTPASGLPHTRLLGLALVASGSLALMRLLRIDATRPALTTIAVAAGAALPLALLLILPVAPGTLMPFHGTVTRLLEWRDGVPVSYEPLLPFPHLARAGLGLPTLAADLGLLGHTPPARAALAVALAGEGLLVLALHALVTPRVSCGVAAAVSLSIPALAHLAGVLPVPGSSPLRRAGPTFPAKLPTRRISKRADRVNGKSSRRFACERNPKACVDSIRSWKIFDAIPKA